MERKVFLIDIDGVACEHAKAICTQVNKEFSLCSKEEDVKTWDHSFGPITFLECVEKYYPDAKFIMAMEVTPGFYDFLEKVKSKKIIVKFASARKCNLETTKEWVKNNFGNYELIFVKSKADLDFDYLIDDHPNEVIEAAKKGKAFLFAKPWNNNAETKNKLKNIQNAFFVDNFSDVICYL